jgi:hypothetical protein
MQTNPALVDLPPPPPRYPFQMVCVYLPEEGHDFPIVRDVQTHCATTRISFVARPYSIDTHADDYSIHRLPAFHILYKGTVQETRYFDTEPIHTLQRLVWAYEDECKAAERARIRRQERWEAFKAVFSLDRFKRKPALDRTASLSRFKNI